jgi:MFS family permease
MSMVNWKHDCTNNCSTPIQAVEKEIYMYTYLYTLRHFNRDVRVLLAIAALIGFTIFGGIYTVLLNLYLLRLGYDSTFIGKVNATGLLAFATAALPAGTLGSRWGMRRTMIAGLFLAAAGYGLLPAGELVQGAWRDSWLLATYLLAMLGLVVYVVNVTPFLTGATTSSERSHAFAVQAALWPLAGFAGSLCGGLLPRVVTATLGVGSDDPAAYRYPLLFAAALLLPAALLLLSVRDVSSERVQADTKVGASPRALIVMLSLVVLLQVGSEGAARTFVNVYLDDGLQLPTAQIGALVAVGQLLAVPMALATPALIARWGADRIIMLGALGMAISLLPLALISHWLIASFSFMSLIALASVARPASMVYQMELIPSVWRAAMSGATTLAAGLSWAGIAWGGGYIIAAFGYRSLFLGSAGLTAVGVLVFWVCFRLPRSGRTPRAGLTGIATWSAGDPSEMPHG